MLRALGSLVATPEGPAPSPAPGPAPGQAGGVPPEALRQATDGSRVPPGTGSRRSRSTALYWHSIPGSVHTDSFALHHVHSVSLPFCFVPSLVHIALPPNRGKKRNLQEGKSDWAIFGTQTFGSQTPLPPPSSAKVRFDTLEIYGQNSFLSRGQSQERIVSFGADTELRKLFALSSVADQPIVVELLLYAVTSVVPPLGDVQGGTLLRVFTEGLTNRSDLECVFQGQPSSPATWVSPTEVHCVTPTSNTSSADCEGEALEVTLTPGHATKNGVPLRRVATPAILEVEPARGYYREPQWVRLTGYGYLDTQQLSCLFYNDAGRQVCAQRCAASLHSCLPSLPAPHQLLSAWIPPVPFLPPPLPLPLSLCPARDVLAPLCSRAFYCHHAMASMPMPQRPCPNALYHTIPYHTI